MQDTINTRVSGKENSAKRIVMIDDNASYSAALALAFSLDNGVEVIGQATSATKGLDVALELQPDLVLCDYRMPDETGIDCAAQLRNNGFGGEIVILTGYAAPNVHADAAQIDDVQVISKDLPLGDIIETINATSTTPTIAPANDTNLDDLILEQIALAETTNQEPTTNRTRKLAAASMAVVVITTILLLLSGLGQAASTGLEQPFVIIDGTASEVRVTVEIDGVATDSFVPANLPLTVAVDTNTPNSNVQVTVENLDDTGTASCSIGAAKQVIVTNTAPTQTNALCATTIN